MGKGFRYTSKPWILKFLASGLLLLSYKVLENTRFESIDYFIRDSLQYLNSPNEVDKSFVTLNINTNSDGISAPHTYLGMKKIIDKLQEYSPKNIIIMMEPLDFSPELREKNKLYEYFNSQKNLYLNKYEARNELASFGNDEIFKNFKRFIHFYKCSDSTKQRENRRALVSLTSFGEVKLFNDLKTLGYQPKSSDSFEYAFEYWNSIQILIKNYPLGTFGNFQTRDLLSDKVDLLQLKDKTVILGTNDEFSHLVSKSPFTLLGMKRELDYQKNWIPLQDVFANNLSHLTTGSHIKFLENIDDLLLVLVFILLIVFSPLKFEKKLYLFLSAIPVILFLEMAIYYFGSFYINFSRSLVVLVLGQYFVLPLVLLWKFKLQEELKYAELNKIRIDALIAVSEHVAHDLRSPLSTVNLLIHKATFQKAEHREILRSALDKIDQIIEEILNSAKAKGAIKLSVLDLSEITISITEEFRVRFPQIEFQVAIHGREFTAPADRLSLIRILNNLIQNSIEAMTDANTLSPKISFIVTEGSSFCEIKVLDNGPGIRPEILELLGAKQVSLKSKSKGFGIGILYSKKLVEELGGNLIIKSELGVGTTVSLQFPKK